MQRILPVTDTEDDLTTFIIEALGEDMALALDTPGAVMGAGTPIPFTRRRRWGKRRKSPVVSKGGAGVTIINLHDKAAARISRREMPSLDEARRLLSGVDPDYVLAIARRVFESPESVSPEELEILIADRRVQLDHL